MTQELNFGFFGEIIPRNNKTRLKLKIEQVLSVFRLSERVKNLMSFSFVRDMENGQIDVEPQEQDMIKAPDHYTFRGQECSDVISTMTAKSNGKIAYYEGAICKYMYRYPMKGTPIQDLMKARQYIEMLIRELQG